MRSVGGAGSICGLFRGNRELFHSAGRLFAHVPDESWENTDLPAQQQRYTGNTVSYIYESSVSSARRMEVLFPKLGSRQAELMPLALDYGLLRLLAGG
ncbi:MAG: hypothetical protein WKF77_05980 [Planctomycetaceae bacterium]